MQRWGRETVAEQTTTFFSSYFADFMSSRSGLSGPDREKLRLLLIQLNAALVNGHSCLPLTRADEAVLSRTHLVAGAGPAPLVVKQARLYLQRLYHYETRLAKQLGEMAGNCHKLDLTDDFYARYFDCEAAQPNWQERAARLALAKNLAIISGGPGTGKTTTVVKILALLLHATEQPIKITLAAPTGKAAGRLSESIVGSIARLNLPEAIRTAIPQQAQTLHRLLGVRRFSPRFHYNSDNPLPWEVVVVDEASMVDLAMMSKLVDAMSRRSRLILLGDKDQLASVESGSVFADLIAGLPGNTVELQTAYRFDDNIKALAESINSGDSSRAWHSLTDPQSENISLMSSDLLAEIGSSYAAILKKITGAAVTEKDEVFTALRSLQVLCGVHHGKRGVSGINRGVEMYLQRHGVACRPGDWYPGRPVLITHNDYNLELYNGDIGICLTDPDSGDLKVWFERQDGTHQGYSPYLLPDAETVFAMTIHKSQGSEFEKVIVVLPEEYNKVLSRELLYTAVTRAKSCVQLVAEKGVFERTVATRSDRFSGLKDQLVEIMRHPDVPEGGELTRL